MTKQLVLSSIVLLACTLRSPAPSGGGGTVTIPPYIAVTVDGNIYDVSDVATTFNASAGLLDSEPWYGNPTEAQQFATAVAVSLGTYNQVTTTAGPLFAYLEDPSDLDTYASVSGSITPVNYSGEGIGSYTFNFAEATYVGPVLAPVPESSASPALLMAAGLFVVWQGWRTMRPKTV